MSSEEHGQNDEVNSAKKPRKRMQEKETKSEANVEQGIQTYKGKSVGDEHTKRFKNEEDEGCSINPKRISKWEGATRAGGSNPSQNAGKKPTTGQDWRQNSMYDKWIVADDTECWKHTLDSMIASIDSSQTDEVSLQDAMTKFTRGAPGMLISLEKTKEYHVKELHRHSKRTLREALDHQNDKLLQQPSQTAAYQRLKPRSPAPLHALYTV